MRIHMQFPISIPHNEKVEGVLKNISDQESQYVREEILVTEATEVLVSF